MTLNAIFYFLCSKEMKTANKSKTIYIFIKRPYAEYSEENV